MGSKKPALSAEEAKQALELDVQNALRDVEKGKPLTARRRALIQSYAEVPEANALPAAGTAAPEYVGSFDELGKIFGLTRVWFSRSRKDYPDAPRYKGNGRHSIAEWKKFFEGHPEIKCKSDSPDAGLAGEDLKSGVERKIRDQELRRLQRENDAADGLLVEKALIGQELRTLGTQQLGMLRQKLENEYPALIAGLKAEQRAELRKKGKVLVDDVAKLMNALVANWTM